MILSWRGFMTFPARWLFEALWTSWIQFFWDSFKCKYRYIFPPSICWRSITHVHSNMTGLVGTRSVPRFLNSIFYLQVRPKYFKAPVSTPNNKWTMSESTSIPMTLRSRGILKNHVIPTAISIVTKKSTADIPRNLYLWIPVPTGPAKSLYFEKGQNISLT